MKCVVKNNSSMDMGPLLPLLKSLLPYTRKKLGFNRPPNLFFASDTENASKPLGKTAFYDPAEVSITVFVDGRHLKDILRSISHELVHHMQHERGDFGTDMDTGEGYAQQNDALRELEREAYESGNMCFRDWEDENRQALQEAKKHFNKESDKMGAKKKINDNIESLLMKKWGFKEQTRQEFNIEVPDAKKSVLSEDLARHVVKEAIKRAGKSLIKEQESTKVGALKLSRDLVDRDPNIRNAARDIFIELFNSDDPYNKDVAIKSIPQSWYREIDNALGIGMGDVNAEWYFRQPDIFNTAQDIINLDPQISVKETPLRTLHVKTMKGRIENKFRSIQTQVRGNVEDRMAPFGLDSYGNQMRVDRDREKSGRYSAEKIAQSDIEWAERLKWLKGQENWRDMEQEQKDDKIAYEYKEFVKLHPEMLTTLNNPNAAVNPESSSWWHGTTGPDRGNVIANATGADISAAYNQLVEDGIFKNPENPDLSLGAQEGAPEVSLEQYTNRYREGVSNQSGEALSFGRSYANSLRAGTKSLYSMQSSSGFRDSGQYSLGYGTGFDEVLASSFGKPLDGLYVDAAGRKIFDLVKDRWEALDEKQRPVGDALGPWVIDAKKEAVGQVGDRLLHNHRDNLAKTTRHFVPDHTEDLTGRARNPQAPAPELGFFDSIKDFVVNAPEHFDTGVKNFKIGAGVYNPFGDGEQGAYEDWTEEEKAAGRTVPAYERFSAVRDIVDARPEEQTKVPQGPQNEDLIRKVVQEALKRKFGE